MRRLFGFIVASLMVMSLTPGIRAEDAQAPADVKVQTQPNKGRRVCQKNYEAYDLGELYVKGEKLPTSQEVTQTSVVTQEEIEVAHSQNVAEALSHVPGITSPRSLRTSPPSPCRGSTRRKPWS